MKNSVTELIDRLAQKRAAREKAKKEKEFWEDWGCLPPDDWNANPPESEGQKD